MYDECGPVTIIFTDTKLLAQTVESGWLLIGFAFGGAAGLLAALIGGVLRRTAWN